MRGTPATTRPRRRAFRARPGARGTSGCRASPRRRVARCARRRRGVRRRRPRSRAAGAARGRRAGA
ncbi:MAG: competence protein TfoX, partial [Chloroflexi bacterium]|nr:competence protein TfoX [Chloroflexota bacterium]